MKKRKVTDDEARLDKMTRDKILQRMKALYRGTATKKEKTRVLDVYCETTGITRTHAIVQMYGGREDGKWGAAGAGGRSRVTSAWQRRCS